MTKNRFLQISMNEKDKILLGSLVANSWQLVLVPNNSTCECNWDSGMAEPIGQGVKCPPPPHILTDQLTLSQPGGADYAHHSTMNLVWLKFAVVSLVVIQYCGLSHFFESDVIKYVLLCSWNYLALIEIWVYKGPRPILLYKRAVTIRHSTVSIESILG